MNTLYVRKCLVIYIRTQTPSIHHAQLFYVKSCSQGYHGKDMHVLQIMSICFVKYIIYKIYRLTHN